MARAVSDKMSAALGQRIVIENRNAGGSGTVGTREVAHAVPDGYTIILGYTSTLATGPHLHFEVLVNGVAQNITFNPTGSWTTWATQNVTFTFNNGTVNTIRFESNGQDLANVDQIEIL